MKKRFILDLQFFAEGEDEQNIDETQAVEEQKKDDKVFTQEDFEAELLRRKKKLEKDYEEKLNKQKEEIELTLKKKDFSKLTEEQQAIEEAKLAKEQAEKETKQLQEELNEFKRKSRKSEVIEKYTSDNLPCAKEFNDIAELISNIDDEETRVDIYLKFKAYATSIRETTKKELLKGKDNPTSSTTTTSSGDNPFKSNNMTSCQNLIASDYEKAKKLWLEAGSPIVFKQIFN